MEVQYSTGVCECVWVCVYVSGLGVSVEFMSKEEEKELRAGKNLQKRIFKKLLQLARLHATILLEIPHRILVVFPLRLSMVQIGNPAPCH